MTDQEVIIVGAGPAGASCAAVLQKHGVPFLLLDRQTFPRDKRCAGWLTPRVFRYLGIRPEDYPYTLTRFRRFVIHAFGRRAVIQVKQYAIRRFEFDQFLLEHHGLKPVQHRVRKIREENGHFILDEQYRCRYLVGAGGSYCPVAAHFFPASKDGRARHISAIEEEFRWEWQDPRCHLWFDLPDLSGYAWYVPKAGGYVNIGIGGFTERMKERGTNIAFQWKTFVTMLENEGLIRGHVWNGKGYNYRVRGRRPLLQRGRVFVTGDAAGLATRDMGEGIAPAIRSGQLAALAIIRGRKLVASRIPSRSVHLIPTVLVTGWKLLTSR